jgi:hypothetical protein
LRWSFAVLPVGVETSFVMAALTVKDTIFLSVTGYLA